MGRAREQIAGIRERIATGTFSFADDFPNFRDLKSVPDSPQSTGGFSTHSGDRRSAAYRAAGNASA
jgi:hypothetical protein